MSVVIVAGFFPRRLREPKKKAWNKVRARQTSHSYSAACPVQIHVMQFRGGCVNSTEYHTMEVAISIEEEEKENWTRIKIVETVEGRTR